MPSVTDLGSIAMSTISDAAPSVAPVIPADLANLSPSEVAALKDYADANNLSLAAASQNLTPEQAAAISASPGFEAPLLLMAAGAGYLLIRKRKR